MPESSRQLKALIDERSFIVAPGVFDLVSARIADRTGFDALYMTGYGVAASYLGEPDAGIATFTDMVGRARQIVAKTTTPLIADADTGFGGLINVARTVRGYEEAGVAAIQIEDQEMPKKCGHTKGRRVVPVDEMVTKIKVALDARRDGILLIARTDARTALGLDEALDRAAAYAEAGADIIFVESPETEAEFEKVGRFGIAAKVPLLANMVPRGRSPVIASDRLQAMGFAIAIYPVSGLSAVAQALSEAYGYLAENGTTEGSPAPDYPGNIHELFGFPEIWDFEKKWGLSG